MFFLQSPTDITFSKPPTQLVQLAQKKHTAQAGQKIVVKTPKNQLAISFNTFIHEFTYDALKNNLFSFPISNTDTIKDPKTKSLPTILIPKSITKDQATTNKEIKVKYLPEKKFDAENIERITTPIEANSLIWLPHPYLIAGSFHNAIYPHDTSEVIWTLLELLKINKLESPNYYLKVIQDQLENFHFQIKALGFPLNGNKGFYITRSQTNNIPSNVLDYYLATEDIDWLKNTGLPMAESIFKYWTSPPAEIETKHGTGYRWIAHGDGACHEVIDSHKEHNFYYFKVLKTLVEYLNTFDFFRPSYAKGFDYKRVAEIIPDNRIKNLDLVKENEIEQSKNIEYFYANNEPIIKYNNKFYKLSDFYYRNDRASRGSGYDTNHLYGPFNAFAYDFIPADHNILLYKHAKDIEKMYAILGNTKKEKEYQRKASNIKEMIMKVLWDKRSKMFYEYNAKNKTLRTNYAFASSAYALWATIFDVNDTHEKEQLIHLVKFLKKNLEGPNGIYASNIETGLHWDKPYTWPIQQGFIVGGLRAYAKNLQDIEDYKNSKDLTEFADRISIKYLLANYSDWLKSKGKSIGEKVISKAENLLTGYATGSNYTWNITTIMYLFEALSEEAKGTLKNKIQENSLSYTF